MTGDSPSAKVDSPSPPNSSSPNSEPSGSVAGNVSEIDWNEVLKANQSWLRTVIAARTGEPAAVDEVWQEVSLAAFLQKAPVQDVNKIPSWLYRVAVLQSLMYRRKMGRLRKMMNRYTDSVQPTGIDKREKNPLESMLSQERSEMVKKALEMIPPKDKEILLLKYIHNWSYKEIAEKLGITIPAIQTRLHRAREKLRQEIDWP